MRQGSARLLVALACACLSAGPVSLAQAPAGGPAAAPATGIPPTAVPPTGVPLDSDYLIFVIDSSGSMRRFAWDRVVQQVGETLDAYGALQGIQVLNDQGDPLLLDYRGEWIPDTPTNRERILSDLANWEAFSTSNPGRGVLNAIDRYYDPEKRIAIHVLGDDFSPGSGANTEGTLNQIRARVGGLGGEPRVRIHAVAFPVYWQQLGQLGTSGDYAKLMRSVTAENGGSFIGLGSSAGDVGREPMTGLPSRASRTLLLVDLSSAASAAQWQRVVAATERLTTEIGAGRAYQIVAFDSTAAAVVDGMDGRWLPGGDAAARDSALAALGRLRAGEGSNLAAAFATIGAYAERPDHVLLLADRLPAGSGNGGDRDRGGNAAGNGGANGRNGGGSATTSADIEITRVLAEARDSLPPALPVSVLLFGEETDSIVAPGYWALALATGGSLVAPGSDWP